MSDTDTTGTPEETPALPGDSLREGVVDELRQRLGEGLVEVELRPNDDLWVRVATDAWAATGTALRDLGFHYFCFLSAIDWLPSPYGRGEDNPDDPPPERSTEIVQGVAGGETRMQVFARVTDIERHFGVTVKVDVADVDPRVDSWHAIYAGANWHEREAHEMFGIGFDGHPDLRNMYLPGDFEGHPLRKDFPLLARMVKPWPGIVDVEPMLAEEADDDEAPPADAEAADVAPDDTPPAADVAGETAPESPTPDQADAGVGEPPAEDAADEAAADTSTAEAPDSSQAPDAEEAPPADDASEPASDDDAAATPGDEPPADEPPADEEAAP